SLTNNTYKFADEEDDEDIKTNNLTDSESDTEQDPPQSNLFSIISSAINANITQSDPNIAELDEYRKSLDEEAHLLQQIKQQMASENAQLKSQLQLRSDPISRLNSEVLHLKSDPNTIDISRNR